MREKRKEKRLTDGKIDRYCRHDDAFNDMAGGYFLTSKGVARVARKVGAPPNVPILFFLFLFSHIPKWYWAEFIINKKNSLWKDREALWLQVYFFSYKSIFIISMCILIVYYFYIIKMKRYYENTKTPLDVRFNFFPSRCILVISQRN
jgi:hypothetical protein